MKIKTFKQVEQAYEILNNIVNSGDLDNEEKPRLEGVRDQFAKEMDWLVNTRE